MHEIQLTHHAKIRMKQRGFRKADIDLFLTVATQVADDAYFLTDHDVAREIERRKNEIQKLERLRGSKIIVEGDALVTLYHAAPAVRQSSNMRGRSRK
jgi:hypothetical protein